MPKYHISPDGVARNCRAVLRACRLGGVNEHFTDKDKAELFYQRKGLPQVHAIRSSLANKFDTLFTGKIELVTDEELRLFPSKPRVRGPLASLDNERAYYHWAESLSAQEQKSIEVIRNQSQQLNSALRADPISAVAYLEDDLSHDGSIRLADSLQIIENLISQHGSKEKELLYHGIRSMELSSEEILQWRDAMVPGSFLEFKSFISSSLSLDTGASFTIPEGIRFEILGEGAMFINTFEEEKLFPHHTSWKVIAKKTIVYNGASTEVIQLLRKD